MPPTTKKMVYDVSRPLKKMNDEVSFKGKSEETTAKSDTNLRGKASGWLRHKGNLN